MGDRTETLSFFMSATGTEDEAVAFMLLEDCHWNLENAVNTFFLMNDSGGGDIGSGGGPQTGGAVPGPTHSEGVYTSEELIPKRVWKVVEADPYGQYPFLYIILGVDKCVVFDTGTGCGDFKGFVDKNINTASLPYLVVCSHVHFDHVGGNAAFQKDEKFLGIAMGNRDQKFTENVEINSLALAHQGCVIKPFMVTRWLSEGELIPLDDDDTSKENSLEVIHTPGHTPDSIALLDRKGGRI